MITTFLLQQHRKQVKILNRINDLNERIKSHRKYLQMMPSNAEHYRDRVNIDIAILQRLQNYYIRISEATIERIMQSID